MITTHYSLERVDKGYQFMPKNETMPAFNNFIDGFNYLVLISQKEDLEMSNFLEIKEKLFNLPYDPEFPINFFNEEYSRFEYIPEAVVDIQKEFPKHKNGLKVSYLMHHTDCLPQIVICWDCHQHAVILDKEEPGKLFQINIASKNDGLIQIKKLQESGKIKPEQATEYKKLLAETDVDKIIEEFKIRYVEYIFISFFNSIFGPMGQA